MSEAGAASVLIVRAHVVSDRNGVGWSGVIFRENNFQPVIERLYRIIAERRSSMPEGSYTAKLFREGIARIAQKVGEEAVELAVAAQYPDTRRCVEEAADLLYHLLVLLAEKNITLTELDAELIRRMPKGERQEG